MNKYNFVLFSLCFFISLASCESKLIHRQEQQLQKLRSEIKRQRDVIEDLKLAKLKMKQKRQDCNQAFRKFEKAQDSKDPLEAVSFYRQGLSLCPDDDVAHYELGKLLAKIGQLKEAQEEFENALRLNPDFQTARNELDSLRIKK